MEGTAFPLENNAPTGEANCGRPWLKHSAPKAAKLESCCRADSRWAFHLRCCLSHRGGRKAFRTKQTKQICKKERHVHLTITSTAKVGQKPLMGDGFLIDTQVVGIHILFLSWTNKSWVKSKCAYSYIVVGYVYLQLLERQWEAWIRLYLCRKKQCRENLLPYNCSQYEARWGLAALQRLTSGAQHRSLVGQHTRAERSRTPTRIHQSAARAERR